MIYIFSLVSCFIIFFVGYEVLPLKVSLTQYAIMFIIVDITLCIHIVLSISRRNWEQILYDFDSSAFIIPMNIVNIIYFFLIKPNEVLSVFVHFSIGGMIVGLIILYILYNMWSVEWGRYIFIGYRDIIFGIISAIVGIFYYQVRIKKLNLVIEILKINKVKHVNVNVNVVEKIRAILENDDIFVLSLEKYIFICVVVFFIIFIYEKIFIYIYGKLYEIYRNELINELYNNIRRNL